MAVLEVPVLSLEVPCHGGAGGHPSPSGTAGLMFWANCGGSCATSVQKMM